MEKEAPSTSRPEEAEKSFYFELQASWGLTKHMGGVKATRELAELCRIAEGSRVLDVGCGVGISACFLAKEFGCEVVGIDISEKMVEKSYERARRKKVEGKVKFLMADAQNLPFEDNYFDAVLGESVNVFIEDKKKAISEYIRVVKSGGYVGFNEATWIKPPPKDLADYLSLALGGAYFLTPDEWKNLLKEAGVKDVVARIYQTNAWRQYYYEVRQMDLRDYLSAWGKFFLMFFKDPAVRSYVKKISRPPKSVFKIFKYFGYGLYVSKK